MKKLVYFLFLLVVPVMFFSACSDDDDDVVKNPTFRYEKLFRDSIIYRDSTVDFEKTIVFDSIVYYDSIIVRDSTYVTNYGYYLLHDSLVIKRYYLTHTYVYYRAPQWDEHLKSYLLRHYDEDHDGELSEEEALKVTCIDYEAEKGTQWEAENAQTQSLKYMMLFRHLETLKMSGCQFDHTSLDVSGLHRLKEMHLSHNTGLDGIALDNDRLEILYCDSSELKWMNVKQAPTLRKLHLTGNQLESLNLAPMSGLKELLCAHNRLTELRIYQHFCVLDCSYNRLKTLDLSEYMMVLDPSDEYRKDTIRVKWKYATRDKTEYEKPDSYFYGKKPGFNDISYERWRYQFNYDYNRRIVDRLIVSFSNFFSGNDPDVFLPNSSTMFKRYYVKYTLNQVGMEVELKNPYYLIIGTTDVPYPYLNFKYQETPATLYIPERSRCHDYPYSCVYFWRTLLSSRSNWVTMSIKGNRTCYIYGDLVFDYADGSLSSEAAKDPNRVKFAQ